MSIIWFENSEILLKTTMWIVDVSLNSLFQIIYLRLKRHGIFTHSVINNVDTNFLTIKI